ncbi:hypothetical protein ZWY2020_056274 [Hordeum vulgare]|nr:hypothetical protein ZWY2020_056274 [Hordeum vulgare]
MVAALLCSLALPPSSTRPTHLHQASPAKPISSSPPPPPAPAPASIPTPTRADRDATTTPKARTNTPHRRPPRFPPSSLLSRRRPRASLKIGQHNSFYWSCLCLMSTARDVV